MHIANLKAVMGFANQEEGRLADGLHYFFKMQRDSVQELLQHRDAQPTREQLASATEFLEEITSLTWTANQLTDLLCLYPRARIKLAAVVDHEGLLLSDFSRGGIIAEDVAPFALLIKANGAGSMNFLSYGCPERVEFQLSNDRIVLCYEESYCLMVIAERHNDDLLNIRINQAMEMVKKYMSERYSETLRPAMEKSYA